MFAAQLKLSERAFFVPKFMKGGLPCQYFELKKVKIIQPLIAYPLIHNGQYYQKIFVYRISENICLYRS